MSDSEDVAGRKRVDGSRGDSTESLDTSQDRVEQGDSGPASAGARFASGHPTTPASATETRADEMPAHPPLITRLGHYSLVRIIAEGGMGTVYEAIQDKPRRTVAVKRMHHGLSSREALRRFETESQTLARLRHPSIAQVYEAGTHIQGNIALPFFAMEYVPAAKCITDYA